VSDQWRLRRLNKDPVEGLGQVLLCLVHNVRGGNDKNTKNIFLPFGVFITWDP
jgi:hypothetical protein